MIRGHLDVLQADFRPWWIVGAVRWLGLWMSSC